VQRGRGGQSDSPCAARDHNDLAPNLDADRCRVCHPVSTALHVVLRKQPRWQRRRSWSGSQRCLVKTGYETRGGVDLQLRVGLNSGQLIPVEIGSGTLGYTVVGEQFGIAQWMESAPRFDAKPYERAYGDFGIVDSGGERSWHPSKPVAIRSSLRRPNAMRRLAARDMMRNAWPRGAYQRAPKRWHDAGHPGEGRPRCLETDEI